MIVLLMLVLVAGAYFYFAVYSVRDAQRQAKDLPNNSAATVTTATVAAAAAHWSAQDDRQFARFALENPSC